jgi:hypothetical protein
MLTLAKIARNKLGLNDAVHDMAKADAREEGK